MRKVRENWIPVGPRQANLVLIAYASSEDSGELAHQSYKQSVKRNRQTESQIPSPSEWLGMQVKICHDGMHEDTNSLDGAQLTTKAQQNSKGSSTRPNFFCQRLHALQSFMPKL